MKIINKIINKIKLICSNFLDKLNYKNFNNNNNNIISTVVHKLNIVRKFKIRNFNEIFFAHTEGIF